MSQQENVCQKRAFNELGNQSPTTQESQSKKECIEDADDFLAKDSPFRDFDLMSFDGIIESAAEGRKNCPQCGKSRSMFCYDCCISFIDKNKFPKLKLPIPMSILKHRQEQNGKSTAIHAKLLAPDCTTILTYPAEFEPFEEGTMLVFPSKDASDLSELKKNCTELKRIVFVDGTWSQTTALCSHKNIQSLPKIKISCSDTRFWRPQGNKPTTYLATIEAIYEFYKQYHTCFFDKYNGEYDNLLYIFAYLYENIQKKQGAFALRNSKA